nr:hypothetical protein [Kosakonia radicincitans]
MAHAHFFQLAAGNLVCRVALHPFHMHQRFGDVLLHRQMRPQVKTLEHHPNPLADMGEIFVRHRFARLLIHPYALAADTHFTAIRLLQPVHAAQQCRFTGAGRTQNAHHRALLHRQVDIPQHFNVIKLFGQVFDANRACFRHGSFLF